MRIQIDDHIEPIFTTYYTIMGRNSGDELWIHIATGADKQYIISMSKGMKYDYLKTIEFDLETYDDELLYKSYYRQKKLARILEDDEENNEK